MTLLQAIGLLAVGTAAGFDLVSGPQVLFARPIIAGTLSGLVLGDVTSGMLVGGMLELFALEVLPVGATRYPDHGPGTVAAVWFTAQWGAPAAGIGVLIALLLSEIGGWSLIRLRRMNGDALTAAGPALDRGEPGMAGRLQIGGALRDLVRSFILTGLGLGVAVLARPLLGFGPSALRMVAVVVLGAGLAGAAAGAVRTAGETRRGIVLAIALIIGWVAAGWLGAFPRIGGI